MSCRFDRDADAHLTREHMPECIDRACKGCRPCTHDADGNPVRHCRTRRRCVSHLGWEDHTCQTCLVKIRQNLQAILDNLAVMPDEATHQGVESEAANLAGPHADHVTASWRLVNADRNGETVEELDMRDPYTCLTMHERMIREDLGHDGITLVSDNLGATVAYLDWVLTDLARSEDHVETLAGLIHDTNALRSHTEAALRDSRAPEKGIPCPDCVAALESKREALEAQGVPRDEWPKKRAPRLIRRHGHWCWDEGCEKAHYLDDSGDTWRCPECSFVRTHAEYEARLVERRRMTA